MKENILGIFVGIALTFSATCVNAKDTTLINPNPESLIIENTMSDVDGYVGGFVDSNGNVNGDITNPDNQTILYPIAGPVYATITNGISGETLGAIRQRGTVSATAEFSISFLGLMGDWSVLPATMPWTMQDDFRINLAGSVFRLEETLTGRAFPHLGPVEDPAVTGTLALRMAGCAGLREISGAGEYAGKIGTLCLNGTFTFDQDFNGKGASNCTIVLQDPLQ